MVELPSASGFYFRWRKLFYKKKFPLMAEKKLGDFLGQTFVPHYARQEWEKVLQLSLTEDRVSRHKGGQLSPLNPSLP